MLIVTIFGMMICLRLLRYGPSQRFCLSDANVGIEHHTPVMTEIILYVLGNLLSQGIVTKFRAMHVSKKISKANRARTPLVIYSFIKL